ncbi:MAG: transglycosylase SLT domain-containing protein [Bdellovibrionales bacterium]|nr:transglycosylase SLT domain-containing protein [Bdellovibrionales bacterium]
MVSFRKFGLLAAVIFSIQSLAGTVIPVAPNGQVDRPALRAYLHERIGSSRLNGYMPQDGEKYGVDGSVNSWVNHFMALAKYESSFNARDRNDADKGGSLGLFQVSTKDGSRYRANPTGKDWTEDELFDPANNATTAVAIYERNVRRDGRIVKNGAEAGAGGYFAGTTMRKIARDAANGTIGDFKRSNATETVQISGQK